MKIKNTIKLNSYAIISDAIERGINWGWIHGHKYENSPDPQTVRDKILDDIMLELCEIIVWEDDYVKEG